MQNKKFSAETLKYIAIIAMTMDHIAFVFVEPDSLLYFFMRLSGRLTAPIMSFFINEGFIYTKSFKKYLLRLFIFALISQPFYFMMLFARPPENLFEFLTNLNVMFTYCIALTVLKILSEKKINSTVKAVLIGVCFAFADLCDWSYIIPVWAIIFFLFRKAKYKNLIFIATSLLLLIVIYLPCYDNFWDFSYQFGVILALIPLNFYNGERKKYRNEISKKFSRWIFYIYYPLHIFVLIILKNA